MKTSLQCLSLGLAASLLPFAWVACGQGAAGQGGAGPVPDLPPIHVEQTEELRRGEAVVDEKNYRLAWKHCQAMPGLPRKPLDAAVVPKLGRTYYRLWYAGQRLAVRTDHWTFKPDSVCRFSPVHTSALAIVRAEGAQLIDLQSRTRHFDPNIRLRPQAPTRPPTREEEALRAKVMAQLRQGSRGDLTSQALGDGSEAGQPCRRGRNAISETCLWSGGDRWGFGRVAGVGVVSWSAYELALRITPSDHGDGQYLSTQRMTVGQPFDRHVFDLPPGLTDD